MGIRLKFLTCCVSCLLCFLGCKPKKESIYQSKNDFMYAYKASVLYGCLNEATDNGFSKFSRDNNDLALAPMVAIIYHAETKEATELGKHYSNKIKPSAYGDYDGKSPIYSSCVYYAFYSKEIDSIAQAKFEKSKNVELQYEEN